MKSVIHYITLIVLDNNINQNNIQSMQAENTSADSFVNRLGGSRLYSLK